jgi:hypothetical protein
LIIFGKFTNDLFKCIIEVSIAINFILILGGRIILIINTESFLLNHLKIILKGGFKVSTEFNQEYYNNIPHKFYKYREVNDNNLKALREDYIWITTANNYKDPLDSTLYFDIYKQRHKILKIIDIEMPKLLFEQIKKEFIKRGVNPSIFKNMNLEDAILWIKNYTFMNGRFKFGKIRGYLKQQGIAKRKSDEVENKLREIQSNKKSKEITENFMNAFSQLNKKIKQSSYLHSFAESYDNPTLWENYTDNDKGFCIEYDLSILEEIGFEKFPELHRIWPIIYKNKEEIDLSELLRLSIKQMLNERDTGGEYLMDIQMGMNIMSKHTKYKYEEEWRLLIEKKKRINNKFKFPFISAIYLGVNIKDSDKKILIGIAKEKDIKVYQRRLNRYENDYEFVSVNLDSEKV